MHSSQGQFFRIANTFRLYQSGQFNVFVGWSSFAVAFNRWACRVNAGSSTLSTADTATRRARVGQVPAVPAALACPPIEDFGRLITLVVVQVGGTRGAMQKLSEYVKTAEAAEILGVSQNTLRSWAEDGRIPMHRNPANGYRLFRRADLHRFLRAAARPVNAPQIQGRD